MSACIMHELPRPREFFLSIMIFVYFQYSIVVLLVLLSEIVVVILWFTMQSEVNDRVITTGYPSQLLLQYTVHVHCMLK